MMKRIESKNRNPNVENLFNFTLHGFTMKALLLAIMIEVLERVFIS